MIGLVRVFAVAFVVLTVIYWSVSFYSRAVRRDKLEALWEERGAIGDKDSFVAAGLAEYDRSLRRRLILAIYIVPAVDRRRHRLSRELCLRGAGMLRYIWIAIKLAILLLVAAFLHYTLPQRDIVYVTDTYNRVIQFGENSIFWSNARPRHQQRGRHVSRDVLFIETVQRDGDVMVYRNEDTGWIWPPYFKFDSSNLQAEASNLKSTSRDPQWTVMTHYGWRIPWMSVFPNAVAIRPIDEPGRAADPVVQHRRHPGAGGDLVGDPRPLEAVSALAARSVAAQRRRGAGRAAGGLSLLAAELAGLGFRCPGGARGAVGPPSWPAANSPPRVFPAR